MVLKRLILSALALGMVGMTGADTIYMKNGHRIDGHITSDTENSYTVDTGTTTFQISAKMIDRVVKYKHRDTSLVLLGDEMVRQQDYVMAREYYERALEETSSPEVIEKRLKAIEEMVLRKDEIGPIDAALKKGQYRLAADLCQAQVENRAEDDPYAAEIKKKASHAYCKLAQDYFDSVRTEEAIFEVQRAIAMDPYNAEAHSLIGMILARTGKYAQAYEELMLAQEIDPADELAGQGLRLLAETTGGYKMLQSSSPKVDTRKLNELLGEAQFSGHTEGIMYAALARRAKTVTPVRFDLNKIARKGGAASAGAPDIYQFRSTRAFSIFLQAYNAGPGATAMYSGNVPYTETVNYVQRVAKAIEDISNGTISPSPYDTIIEKYAMQFGFHPTLIKAIVKVESDFNPKCVSTADARGLIQLVRVDWVDTMKRLEQNIDFDDFVFDPELNIMVGCHYLRWLVDDCLPKYFKEDFG